MSVERKGFAEHDAVDGNHKIFVFVSPGQLLLPWTRANDIGKSYKKFMKTRSKQRHKVLVGVLREFVSPKINWFSSKIPHAYNP